MLGVHASTEYLFFIILSPVGSYYAHGLEPTKLLVEDFYVRSAIGGTGEAKCLGNYAASMKAGEEAEKKGFDQVLWLDAKDKMKAGEEAEKKGFDQVLWLDAKDKKYVEEVGSMNMFFVINGEVVTPAELFAGAARQGLSRQRAPYLHRRSHRSFQERHARRGVRHGYGGGHLSRRAHPL